MFMIWMLIKIKWVGKLLSKFKNIITIRKERCSYDTSKCVHVGLFREIYLKIKGSIYTCACTILIISTWM